MRVNQNEPSQLAAGVGGLVLPPATVLLRDRERGMGPQIQPIGFALCAGVLIGWIVFPTEERVRRAAMRYAKQLLAALPTLTEAG
jgi:hypothetical protein